MMCFRDEMIERGGPKMGGGTEGELDFLLLTENLHRQTQQPRIVRFACYRNVWMGFYR